MRNRGAVSNVIRGLVFGYECHRVDPVAPDPPAEKLGRWIAGRVARDIELALKVAYVLCSPRLQKLLDHPKLNGRSLIFFLHKKIYKISEGEKESAIALMISSLRPHLRQILCLKDRFSGGHVHDLSQ